MHVCCVCRPCVCLEGIDAGSLIMPWASSDVVAEYPKLYLVALSKDVGDVISPLPEWLHQLGAMLKQEGRCRGRGRGSGVWRL